MVQEAVVESDEQQSGQICNDSMIEYYALVLNKTGTIRTLTSIEAYMSGLTASDRRRT